MQITRGKIRSAQKVVVYGPEGIGKSTFAARFPDPLFIDTEGSTKHMDVARLPKPSSWAMMLEQVRFVRDRPDCCGTLVIDTADWAEQLCSNEICAKAQKSGIEDFGYGKGYVYLTEEFGKLLNLLEELVERDINVCFTAHAQMRKFEQPDEMGAYDRWELKLQKKTAPMLKEWADMVLFANYKTYVINVDDQGVQKGKNKVQGGARVLHTTHHPCWDAKNRHDLPAEMPLDYAKIAHCIPAPVRAVEQPPPLSSQNVAEQLMQQDPRLLPEDAQAVAKIVDKHRNQSAPPTPPAQTSAGGIPKPLLDLMQANGVSAPEIQQAVADKGIFPRDMPIMNYPQDFVDGVLVGAWPQVYAAILLRRENPVTPF